MAVTLKALSGQSPAQLAQALNTAFQDYAVPISITKEAMTDKMEGESVDLSRSIGAYANGELVGFIQHGVRGDHYYNATTGVFPSFRGQQLTERMYAWFLERFSPKSMQLEVLINNDRALKVYRSVGFAPVREVLGFKTPLPMRYNRCGMFTLQPLSSVETINTDWWDSQPTWGYNMDSIRIAWPKLLKLGAYKDGQCLGYILYHPNRQRLLSFAVHPDWRRSGIGSQLLVNLQQRVRTPFSIINVDTRAQGFIDFLTAMGCQQYFRQFEMMWEGKG